MRVMSRQRLVMAAATLALVLGSFGLASGPVSAHNWGDFCGPNGFTPNPYSHQLLIAWQDQSFDGLFEWDCGPSDSNWGDSIGGFVHFNDIMTSYHAKDRNGDGVYTCFTMYEHTGFGGDYFSATNTRQSGGYEFQETNVGSGWNDHVSSDTVFNYSNSGLCP